MSSDFKALLPGLLILASIVIGSSYLVDRLEQVPETRYLGYQGEASYNQYLAISLLLERMGLEVRRPPRLENPSDLPPPDGTLFLPGSRDTYSEKRHDTLLDWVEQGGHLVISASVSGYFVDTLLDDEGEKTDRFLERLGVAVVKDAASEAMWDDGEWHEVVQNSTVFAEPAEAPFLLPGTEKPVRASLLNSLRVDPERARWTIGAPSRARIVHLVRGKGRITVLSNSTWLQNLNAGDFEHATLAYFLATLDGRFGEVWVVYGADVPGFLTLVLASGWPALLASAIALALWLLSKGRRFGPRHAEHIEIRRSVLEHIEATGHFLWERGAVAPLVDSVRSAVLRKAARHVPSWQELSVEERRAHVQEVTGLSQERLSALFAGAVPHDNARFASIVRNLREINDRL